MRAGVSIRRVGMTFTDFNDFSVDNYELRRGDMELYLYLELSYKVEVTISRHPHSCPAGDDYPDGEECICRDVTLDYYEVYDADGNEIDLKITPDEERSICLSMHDAAEEHYSEYGYWGDR